MHHYHHHHHRGGSKEILLRLLRFIYDSLLGLLVSASSHLTLKHTRTHARTEAKASHFNVMSNIFMSICRQARWPQLAERPSSRPAAGLCALSWTHCVSAPRQRRSSADCGDISGLTNRLQCHLSSGDIKHANLEGAVMVVVVGGSSHRNAPAMIQQPHGSD